MFFVISDVHASESKMLALEMKCEKYLGRSLDRRDVIMSCGDLLGAHSHDKKKRLAADKAILRYLEDSPYQVYSVYGNHDRSTKLLVKNAHVDEQQDGTRLMRLCGNVAYMLNGGFYKLEDGEGNEASFIALGESSPHFGHIRNNDHFDKDAYVNHVKMRLSEQNVPAKVTAVLSHDCPDAFLGPWKWFYGKNKSNAALSEIRPVLPAYDYWLFGHEHRDFSYVGGTRCLNSKVAVLHDGKVQEFI